jgi:superfamily II DNA or RNA helicase
VWPKGHVAEGQPIVLRDYQVEVINNFLGNPQSLQEVATGAGKTIITATLSHLCEPYGRSLVIVPNKSLVVQTEEDYVNVGLDVGVYFGDRKELGHTHTICTWQSLNILSKKTKNHEAVTTFQEAMEDVKCIIVDEVHQAKADVLKQLLTQNFAHVPIRWGLTGTIPKEQFEFQGIKAGLGEVINHISAHDLQQKGVLANCHVNIVQTDDVQEFGNYQEELKYLVTSEHRIDWMAKLIDKIKDSGNTLILVDRISAGKMLEERLEGSVFVSGETKGTDRKEHYDSIKDSTNKIIIATYGVAAVGINIPRIFNLVLIEPGKSFVRVIQSIGRGIRKAEDKDFVQIWDLTSKCKFAKRHLTQRKKYYKEANYPFTIEKIAID